MTMSQYCQSCSKCRVCLFSDQIIEFANNVNESFAEQFSDSYIADMMTIDFRCNEYLRHVVQRSPDICP